MKIKHIKIKTSFNQVFINWALKIQPSSNMVNSQSWAMMLVTTLIYIIPSIITWNTSVKNRGYM